VTFPYAKRHERNSPAFVDVTTVMKPLVAALVVLSVLAACANRPPSSPLVATPGQVIQRVATPATASLAMDAAGLGPCKQPWWTSCNYGIRVEGPGGYDHRGNFIWDQGRPPNGELAHGPNGDMPSTGVGGDVPATLGPGEWTISFRLWYGSDSIQYGEPVPGGTPRYVEEDPFKAACSTLVDTSGVASITLHVAFDGSRCTVVTQLWDR
jgi:hypothetical protein